MRALLIVVALGIGIGMLWTRDSATSRPAATKPAATKPAATKPATERGRTFTLPSFSGSPGPLPVKTLEPTSDEPEYRAMQEVLWQELRSFVKDAKLTDAQWERFQRDLSELAIIESSAWANGIKVGFEGIIELSRELDRELLVRCAEYMTEAQIAELRFRFMRLVTQVRRLHYLPTAETVMPDPES